MEDYQPADYSSIQYVQLVEIHQIPNHSGLLRL